MKIICLVKCVPDANQIVYDLEKNTLDRKKAKTIVNPDDAAAVEVALRIKDKNETTEIEIVTMGRASTVVRFLEGYLRRGVDKATLISDKKFMGSDTLATSRILASYLNGLDFDLILSGNITIDGETGHVGAQVATFLGISQFSNVVSITKLEHDNADIVLDYITSKIRLNTDLPCLLSVDKQIVDRIRFTKFANLKLNVSDKLTILSNESLNVDENLVGLKGSPTKVKSASIISLEKKERVIVKDDDDGVDTVYQFLKEKGFI